mgnify:CR=1 FL=1
MTINLDDLTLGQIKQLQALACGATPGTSNDPDIGKYVIVRTYGAGVHVGVLVSRTGKDVRLSDTRRVWQWKGALTLSELSLRGLTVDGSRVSETIAVNTLTDAMEIIPCTKDAETILRGAKWTK